MSGVPILIDTDGGIDDAVALWWLLNEADVDLVAVIVTAGNIGLDGAAANVRRVLQAAGRRDVPVALGASAPLGPTPLTHRGAMVHGDDGLGGTAASWPYDAVPLSEEPAGRLLARLTSERPGQLDLVTIGPLSTLGAAVRSDPELASSVRRLTVMGGTVRTTGNALPIGEANIGHDPEAAAAVGAAAWSSAPTLVGLDITMAALLSEDDLLLAAEERTVAAEFLAAPLRFYADFYRRSGQSPSGTFPCHDLLAAMVAVDPSLLTHAPEVPLGIDTGRSAAWGTTVADLRASPQSAAGSFHQWKVGLEVDAQRFRDAFRRLMAGRS